VAFLREWLRRLLSAVWPSRRDGDLEAELRSHLELAADNARPRYASDGDTRRAVHLSAGGVPRAMDALRAQRTLPWLDDLARDLRHGVRTLRRQPRFVAVAVLTLSLSIGANTAIFSLVDAVLLRPLPVADPGTLVLLRQRGPTNDIYPFTSAAAAAFETSRDVVSGIAAFRPNHGTHVRINGDTELASIQLVSGSYYAILGVTTALGRPLTQADRDPVAVISDRYWRRRFRGDPGVIGQTLDMQGRSFTVVGVTPPEFFGTQPGRYVDVTVPLAAQTMSMPPNARWLYLIGRLTPGGSREQAEAALRVQWSGISAGASTPTLTLHVDPGAQGLNELRRGFSLPLRILTAAMAVVLLLACANLAGLLMARSAVRQHDIAVRHALGASRARIARQLLTESALLAATGGLLGSVVAYLGTQGLLAVMSRGRVPLILDVTPNARTLAFTAAITSLAAAMFGLLPALTSSRSRVQAALKSFEARIAPRGWGRTLVAAQVALLVLLLTSAGLFAGTLRKLYAVDPGFDASRTFLVRIQPGPAYRGPAARQLHEELGARFSALPGVQSVSSSMDTPLGGEMSMSAGLVIPGRPPEPDDGPQVFHNIVGPRFFETMGIPVVAGRDFSASDDEPAERSIVISESVARRYWPDADPLGRQISLSGAPATIVGVVKDVRYTSLRRDPSLVVYRSSAQEPRMSVETFLIRTSLSQAAVTAAVQGEVRATTRLLPPPDVTSLRDQIAGALVNERLLAMLSTAVGGCAVILAAVGIYSAVAAVVGRRRREIGIRLALGAKPRQVVRLVVSDASVVVVAGLVSGVLLVLATQPWTSDILASVLFDLSPASPAILGGVTATIAAVAALAAFGPARRALKTDLVAVMKPE